MFGYSLIARCFMLARVMIALTFELSISFLVKFVRGVRWKGCLQQCPLLSIFTTDKFLPERDNAMNDEHDTASSQQASFSQGEIQ